VVLAYIGARRRLGFARTVGEAAQMSASISGYLQAVWPLIVPFAFAGLAVLAAVAGRLGSRRRRLPLLGLALVGGALAFWLSLGPEPVVGGTAVPSLGLYRVLQEFVPGMTVLRVSSRFAVAFVLFLSVAAGLGASLMTGTRRGAGAIVVLALISVWLNSLQAFPRNHEAPSTVDVVTPAPYLTPGPEAPEVYRYLASLSEPAIIAELPFTDLWYNTRYLFFSTFHWHRLVNGFTSFFPPDYEERARWLVNPVRTPDEAYEALTSAGTTHVVVHTGAWDPASAHEIQAWLLAHGARSHGSFDGAVVYELAH